MGFLSRHGEAFWKLVTIIVWAAIFFLKTEFVMRETYERQVKEDAHIREQMLARLNEVATDLRILRERRTDDPEQNNRIADHEVRIRALEKLK